MRHACRLASVLLLASASPLIAAQPSSDTIVVKGTRLDPLQARQRAVDFVNRTGVAHGQQQVARWAVPVCIKVIGLQKAYASRVERVMHGIAREANIKVAGRKCDPNITVSFTPDAGKVVQKIVSRRPQQLRELTLAEKQQLLTGEAAARWWYATGERDRDGVEANNLAAPWITMAGTTTPLPLVDGVRATQQYNSASNLRTPVMRQLFGATVVIDSDKASNLPLDSVAAYAAMVAFAEIDASSPPPDSILGLFAPDGIETSLTDWDMAFLKSLYRMPLDRTARIQRGHLVEALLDERLPRSGSAQSRE